MNINAFISNHPWVPLVFIIVFFAFLAGYSIFKGKKGEIPINLKNPDIDKRRPDIGSTDSRVIPRN
ncbi:MAG: hypothetical protein K8R67_02030 [Desulfobacteraceae bacterium]|nr:hypothetical protein [Desulfobacteraceae bacterium]